MAQIGVITIPPEVESFAREQGVADELPAVLELAQRLFPEARRIGVVLEEDPDIPDYRSITVEVEVVSQDAGRYAKAHWQWAGEISQVCRRPYKCLIRLFLNLVEP